MSTTRHIEVDIAVERWEFDEPFRITGYVHTAVEVLVVSLSSGDLVGRGEAAGVYYHNETASSLASQVDAVRKLIEAGVDRQQLYELLPAGGARNAVDCALWDLEAKCSGIPAWQRIGLDGVRPLLTAITIGVDTPQTMAAKAVRYAQARMIKLKLDGSNDDSARVNAVREARPDVDLTVDANQGWTMGHLDRMIPELIRNGVKLIEQPLPIGRDGELEGFSSPIPIAADESIQDRSDLPAVLGRYQAVNIKLDKTGGLTEALALASAVREQGLSLMVGNMAGTSLSLAPQFLLGQLCDFCDLDGPVSLVRDRAPCARYEAGYVDALPTGWGIR